MLHPLLVALQFLTVLPVRLDHPPDATATGRSLLCYPLVGLLIGVLLAAAAWMLGDAPPLLAAAVLLSVWITMTGALHLDGLADSADAWVGGRGDRDRTLAIMKDPRSGPMGVTAVVQVLLVKFSALVTLCEAGDLPVILLVPCLGRTALPLLFLTTPYVRPGGLGATLSACLPRRTAGWVVAATSIGICLVYGMAWLLLLASACAFFLLRAAMMRRIGGTTGDTAGAVLEITETIALVTGAVIGSVSAP